MKNDHSSVEEKHQFERRNMGQKRWSECLIYWWIRQMTRWCVMYTGDCPPSLHTLMNGLYILYEWTLIYLSICLIVDRYANFTSPYYEQQFSKYSCTWVLVCMYSTSSGLDIGKGNFWFIVELAWAGLREPIVTFSNFLWTEF